MTAKAICMFFIYFTISMALVSCLEFDDMSQISIQGKRLIQSTFRKIDVIGPKQCLKECYRRTRECKSINYMKKQFFCELSLANTTQGNVTFENDGDYFFISISGIQSHNQGCWTTKSCGKNDSCLTFGTELNICIEERFEDCQDLRKQGAVDDGIFTITPQPPVSKPVFCDMNMDGGGWMGCWTTKSCGKNDSCLTFGTELNICIEERFEDCQDLRKQGAVDDGIFTITPQPPVSKPVFCDMNMDGGGWMGCWTTKSCGKNDSCLTFGTELNICIEERFEDCQDLRKQGAVDDGIFTITPQPPVSKPVFCDMNMDGGGWVTVLHRIDPFELSFNRSWSDFKEGFADATFGEQWIGNEFLHLLTKHRMSDIYFRLQATNGVWSWAKYNGFYVAGENTNYTIYYNASSYTGTAGEGLTVINGSGSGDIYGRQFGTFDRDISDCAKDHGGGWWFRGQIGCAYSMLTYKPPYWNGEHTLVGTLKSLTVMVRAYREL